MDKNAKIGIIGALSVLLIIIIVVATTIVGKLTPSKEVKQLSDYYQVPEGEALVIMDDVKYEKYAKVIDGVYYMDLETIQSNFNKRFYFDFNENVLINTTPTEVIKAEVGSKDYSINKNKVTTPYTIVKRDIDDIYVALDFVAQYSDMRFKTFQNPDIVMIESKWGEYLYATVKSATQIRTGTSIKSEILKQVAEGDQLMIINNGGSMENGFICVMSEDGVRGYAQKKALSDTFYQEVASTYEAPVYTNLSKDYTINLTWHQVTVPEANKNVSAMLEATKGVTTISPTWFRVNSQEGTLSSLASESYVDYCHSRNIEVWGLVDNFDPNVDIHQVLSRTSTREKLVNEIIAQAIKYDLDGINIDFESLKTETGPHYVQFLRELSVKCRSNQIVLSVDNYVPANYNKFYDYKEQGAIVDYVVIMAYDEYHGASEEAGSVSSINYFTNAINDTKSLVPAEKIIIGVPFYTRLWKESTELGEKKLTSEALGMAAAEQVLAKNNVEAKKDESTGQDYAEFQKEDTFYKIWLENEESVNARMKLIYDAKVAGVASWRLGFEKASIWDIILKYVN
ncbi:MAG: glycosyl hydrolase family 18 protein [Clostridiales bacterium]|nr:glycosyl hydrolase family 18 protein [Clostridiales bacterium]